MFPYNTKKMICPNCKKEVEVVKKEDDGNGTIISHFSCGHKHFEKNFIDSISLLDMLNLKNKGMDSFSKDHKFKYEETIGERIGGDGKVVFIHRVIDRFNNIYKELVRQRDKIIRDIQEKLTSHK